MAGTDQVGFLHKRLIWKGKLNWRCSTSRLRPCRKCRACDPPPAIQRLHPRRHERAPRLLERRDTIERHIRRARLSNPEATALARAALPDAGRDYQDVEPAQRLHDTLDHWRT